MIGSISFDTQLIFFTSNKNQISTFYNISILYIHIRIQLKFT